MNVVGQEIVRVYPDSKSERKEALLLKEHSLLIKVNGTAWTSLVCSDTNLMELVAGHLLSCGLVETKDDIARIDLNSDKSEAAVCLSRSLDAPVPLKKIEAAACEPEWIFNLAKAFSNDSALHKRTAGTHSCILAKKGQPLFAAEDIGRHTALDKALGWMLLNGVPAGQAMLYTSGRVPVDMVEKVVRARVGVLISKSVPTAQSVALAKDFGLKLFFRAWPDSFDAAVWS